MFITNRDGFVKIELEIHVDKSRRKFHTEKLKFYNTTEKKIRDVEVCAPYKQLRNEGFQFYNSETTDIPQSFTIKLNEHNKIVSQKLEWHEKKRNLSRFL